MKNAHFTLNGKTHIAAEWLTAEQARTRLSDKPHWSAGAVITACRLSLATGDGQLDGPGVPATTTCGNCRRSKQGKGETA